VLRELVPHVIEVFTAGCPLCRTTLDMIEVGKCASCVLIERDLTRGHPGDIERARSYGVRAVPTIIIDGRIKVEGEPDFPWLCGDDFYSMLETRFPLRPAGPATHED